METQKSDPVQQPTGFKVPTKSELAAKRSLIPVAFSLAVVLFFFTFAEFRCQGRTIGSATGFNLVLGKEMKEKDQFSGQEKSKKISANMWAIFALIAGVVGAAAFYKKDRREELIGTAAGAVGFVSLLILQFTMKSSMKNESGGQVEVSFQFAYWLALLAFGFAGFISYLRKQNLKQAGSVGTSPVAGAGDNVTIPKAHGPDEPLKKDDIVGG